MPPSHRSARLLQPLPGLAERPGGQAGTEPRCQPARVQRQAHQDPGVRLYNQHEDRDVSANSERAAVTAMENKMQFQTFVCY